MGSSSLKQFTHMGWVREYDEVVGPELEAQDVAVDVAPLLEAQKRLLERNLMEVADEREGSRARREQRWASCAGGKGVEGVGDV